jgi:hypothetical protein
MTQPACSTSNSSVKNCGNGVVVGSGVAVGAGVSVAGTEEGEGVSVGKSDVERVGVADWQAVTRRNPKNRIILCMMSP